MTDLLTKGTVELEGFGDLTLGQVAEVGDDGSLGELEVVFGFNNSKQDGIKDW